MCAATTRIVLADDHRVVRAGLRLVLNAAEDLEVVAEAGDIDEAFRKLRAYHPDVLVLDLKMPGRSSLETIPTLRDEAPQTAIVVLTAEDDLASVRQAMRGGALGYVLKESAAVELVEAVRMAAIGRTYLTPQLGARLAAQPPTAASPDLLSDREVVVLRLIALGHTNGEIAATLYLSVRTVESHRASIQQKTRRSTRAELVAYALEHGLIERQAGPES